MFLRISSRKENDDTVSYLACDHHGIRKAKITIRRDAFDHVGNSLESTNHRENDRSPLRLAVANKTPLHELVKCSSMESMLTRMRIAEREYCSVERTEIARSHFLFVVTLEAGSRTKRRPSDGIFLLSSNILSLSPPSLWWAHFLRLKNCKNVISLVFFC